MKVKGDLTALVCQWAADDEGIWETGCGELFQFDADGPQDNGFKFCPYCGKGLCEVSRGFNRTF